jgi:hypothetical protein
LFLYVLRGSQNKHRLFHQDWSGTSIY